MFELIQTPEFEYFSSDILPSEHLFHEFTTSKKDFALGTGGDYKLEEKVNLNRKKICDYLKIPYENLIVPQQTHSNNIVIVENGRSSYPETDGLITDKKNIALMLLFADCVPVILYASDKNVIAVLHAGWRGTAQKIAKKGAEIIIEKWGAKPENIKATIGAAIGQCCYPVSEDVAQQLASSLDNNYKDLFKKDSEFKKVNVDLKGINFHQLKETGVKDIDILGYCTCCNNDLFYSYRAFDSKTARHGAIAMIK